MVDNSDAHFSIESGLQEIQGWFMQFLEIKRTIKNDTGCYFCVLFDSAGMQVTISSYIVLTVKYPPADHFPLCTAVPKDVGDEITVAMRIRENRSPNHHPVVQRQCESS